MTASSAVSPRLPRAALATAGIWFALAALAGASGLLLRLAFPIPQLTIVGLVVASLVAVTAVPSLRAWIDAIPVRSLVAVHAVRFVGIAFLILASQGRLAQAFGQRAGWGDIAAAALALVVVASGDPVTAGRRALYHGWNVLGFTDLIVAVGTATWVVLQAQQPGMQPLFSFPLSLVPLFFVPLLLVGHIVIFRRLLAAGRSSDDA